MRDSLRGGSLYVAIGLLYSYKLYGITASVALKIDRPVPPMNRKQLINHLAERFTVNATSSRGGTNMIFVKQGYYRQVWSYMRRWLDDHDALPTGEHVVPQGMDYDPKGRPQSPYGEGGHAMRIDFTRLRNDPEYPKAGRDSTYVPIKDAPPPFSWD